MREVFVSEIVKDILGPRGGYNEEMRSSPLSEYITGVLAPTDTTSQEIDKMDVSEGVPELNEDEMQEQDVCAPPLVEPALDPKSRPVSFGLAFMVESEKRPEAHICLTWARYGLIKREKETIWKRKAKYSIFSLYLDKDSVMPIDANGKQTSMVNAEISFHVLSRKLKERKWIINLYFVNRIRVPRGQHPTAEYHIFQPQIRVSLYEGTKLIPLEETFPENKEAKELAFLYRTKPVKARGHLCSAIWKEIDPESKWDGKLDFPHVKDNIPFSWVDSAIIPDNLKKQFICPDVRTEFIPMYSIPFPEINNWPIKYGSPPKLIASELAESFSPKKMSRALQPFIKGYSKWIRDLRQQIESLSPSQKKIAQNMIDKCVYALTRIKKGIDILLKDKDVRLAFCFANKAMDIQSIWRKKRPLQWRPFQLGYILAVLESIANPHSKDRDICDILWVPTGAGKTEAYLFLIVFTIALRRLRIKRMKGTEGGVAIIMRYTLRLLTIQQFRRLLAAITACEFLRVEGLEKNGQIGWAPASYQTDEKYVWGTEPFSAGLWVGGGVTPNRLENIWTEKVKIPGAISILKGEKGEGEAAQITHCPACSSVLAIPEKGLSGNFILHLVVRVKDKGINPDQIVDTRCGNIIVADAKVTPHSSPRYFTLSLHLKVDGTISSSDIDTLWSTLKGKIHHIELEAVRASRPGYFIRWYVGREGNKREYDFQIFCPNPDCPLHRKWNAMTPAGCVHGSQLGGIDRKFHHQLGCIQVPEPFQARAKRGFQPWACLSDRIPIPAYTVDEQIYSRLPSVVVATVDKFARLAFEPRAAALFGNVTHYHCIWGYYRLGLSPSSSSNENGHPSPTGRGNRVNYVKITPPDPPDLILQDELHLIDGPLGSLVGFYETGIAFLCESKFKPKYIASTATIRNAQMQVKSIFNRDASIFPPHGLTADDRFFIRERESHPLDDNIPGRLYLGVCAPGRGPLTPLVRIYSRLLQTAEDIRHNTDVKLLDPFWTLTLYFNALRELGGARALYRQDIPGRIFQIAKNRPRMVSDDRAVELSSRTTSTYLPALLDFLSRSYPEAPDILFTTSMFGTGVDIPRISLMVVNGQPKTTSSYIQATGRVGRVKGALVATFLRATRPRDLSHYEFFCGYHRQIHRYVEPVSVYPFAPNVIKRCAGPLSVLILRNRRDTKIQWYMEKSAHFMSENRHLKEVMDVEEIIEKRAQNQPEMLRPLKEEAREETKTQLDKWKNIASRERDSLRYVEYAIRKQLCHPVVLGDPAHEYSNLDTVYKNAPDSLREIEETCGFET